MKSARITSKGQVTIPQEIRGQAGLLSHTEVEFIYDGKAVRIVRADRKAGRGARLVARMRGRGSGNLSTDQITAMTRRR
ncbi:MAG: AbrB/MazE/SpoVT family DNA-binding domain-containing protein [Proteobacteria bacterium]|nr:AbrB/MazE/SpoVT family DNA-binding domain-containing protein [Pseudomonadota bacterium]